MADLLDVPVSSKNPKWVKVTKTYTDFATAGLSNDIEIYSLPAAGVIHAVKAKHTTGFSGLLISAATVSVGISGNFTKYMPIFDVLQAPGDTAQGFAELPGTENHASAVSIRAQAIVVGAFLSVATTGSVDFWILVSFAS